MAKRGYDGASVADIAKAARLTPGPRPLPLREQAGDPARRAARSRRAPRRRPRAPARAKQAAIRSRELDGVHRLPPGPRRRRRPEALACWILLSGEALREPKVRVAFERGARSDGRRVSPRSSDAASSRASSRATRVEAAASALVATIQGYFVLAATARNVIPEGSAAASTKRMAEGLLRPVALLAREARMKPRRRPTLGKLGSSARSTSRRACPSASSRRRCRSCCASRASRSAEIGLTSLLALPWALKFLWAPAVDRCSIPRLGRRKSWIVPLQLARGRDAGGARARRRRELAARADGAPSCCSICWPPRRTSRPTAWRSTCSRRRERGLGQRPPGRRLPRRDDRGRRRAAHPPRSAGLGADLPGHGRAHRARHAADRCSRASRRHRAAERRPRGRGSHFLRRPGALRLLAADRRLQGRRRVRDRHAAPAARRRRAQPGGHRLAARHGGLRRGPRSARCAAARSSIGSGGGRRCSRFGAAAGGRRRGLRLPGAGQARPAGALRAVRRRALRRRHGDGGALHLHDGLVLARAQRHRLHGAGERRRHRHRRRRRRSPASAPQALGYFGHFCLAALAWRWPPWSPCACCFPHAGAASRCAARHRRWRACA